MLCKYSVLLYVEKEVVIIAFTEAIKKMVGQPCWGFVAGEGTGSVVSLQIGGKVPRTILINNPSLTIEQQQNTGEYVLLIECAWRLETKTKVICGAWDDNSENGSMKKGLRHLLGHKIEFIDLSKPGLDLKIGFDNGFMLQIFCDSTNLKDKTDNYSFHLNLDRVVYIVTYRSKLKIEHNK